MTMTNKTTSRSEHYAVRWFFLVKKGFLMFLLGGAVYVGLELLWRGSSHISMFFAGGLSAALIFTACSRFPLKKCPWFVQCLFGSIVITGVEFCTGAVMNLWLRENIWDYSALPFNVLGQICLPFSAIWFVLTLPVLWVGRLLDHSS